MIQINTSSDDQLSKAIGEWLNYDQYEPTRNEIINLVNQQDWDALKKRLFNRLQFGTAGLRGKMQAGYSGLNDLLVIQMCQGLAKYLISHPQLDENLFNEETVLKAGILIGYDGRHNSKRFAQRACAVFNKLGFKVYLFSRPASTPFVPFGIRKLKTAAGIVVTASHNPKDDNGVKVYLANGCQIISPHDSKIQKEIDNNLKPWDGVWNLDNLKSVCVLDELIVDYMSLVKSLVFDSKLLSQDNLKDFKLTYTSLHGVGHPYVTKAFEAVGLKEGVNVFPVEKQKEIDPNFSTVKFPNPEEGAGVLDLSIENANLNGCDLIIANDPDTDRCSVAERQKDGKFRQFTGNELGTLLGWFSWFKYNSTSNKQENDKVFMISSTVSSHILETIAKKEKFNFIETLTGFKYMGNITDSLLKENYLKKHDYNNRVLFAFEEAIGFMSNSEILDKDGITAAIEFTQLALYLRKVKNTSLNDWLFNGLYGTYGYHYTYNSYYICHESEVIKKIFHRIFHYNGKQDTITYPWCFGDNQVTRIRDLTNGYDSHFENSKPELPVSSSSFMITFYFEEGNFITIRTSGTEPKIKFYSEIVSKPGETDLESIRRKLENLVNLVTAECLQPEINQLKKPSN